jgi:hypothetical protein
MMSWSSIQAMTLTNPPQRPQISISILKTRLSLWAHVIAAWRSAGELSYSVLVVHNYAGRRHQYNSGCTWLSPSGHTPSEPVAVDDVYCR